MGHTMRDGVRRALPLAVAVATFGLPFGVLAHAVGLGSIGTIIFSITTFAGSAQFAAASVLAAGGTAAAAVGTALLVNSRYIPIGLSLASSLTGPWWKRALQGQLAVDESWAISNLGGGRYDRSLLLGAGLIIYAAWVIGTVLGVLVGGVIGDPANFGLDALFPALFLFLLVSQIRDRRGAVAALLGAAIALALVPFTPAGVPIIAASLGCLVGVRR